MKQEVYLERCIELALNGLGNVAPNPMVGAVVVYDSKIIGEGFHRQYGMAHAEVNAIESVHDKKLLSKSTLYVSLEPCNHFGKTPPCTDLIKKYKIPHVVVGSLDSNPQVKGNGIASLKTAGIKVTSGVLEKECKELNKRFFYSTATKKPYVILKWAQSSDGFIGLPDKGNVAISNEFSQQLVHKWRSEESAIMVGTKTALLDNPHLNVRHAAGKHPLRVVMDWNNRLSESLHLFDKKIPTLVFCGKKQKDDINLTYLALKKSEQQLETVLSHLAELKIQSLLVEGGAQLLQSFIDKGWWNEARIFTSDKKLKLGVKAPKIKGEVFYTKQIKNDTLVYLKNKKI